MVELARGTHRIEIARAERATILENLVEALLHGRQFVCLGADDVSQRAQLVAETELTMGINSSETGSLDESKR